MNLCKYKRGNVQQLRLPSTGQRAPRPNRALKHWGPHYLNAERREHAKAHSKPHPEQSRPAAKHPPPLQALVVLDYELIMDIDSSRCLAVEEEGGSV